MLPKFLRLSPLVCFLSAGIATAAPVTIQFDLTDFRQNPFRANFLDLIGETGATSATAILTYDDAVVPFNTQSFSNPSRTFSNYDYLSFTLTIGGTTISNPDSGSGFPDQVSVTDTQDLVGGTNSDGVLISANTNQILTPRVEIDYFSISLSGAIDVLTSTDIPSAAKMQELIDTPPPGLGSDFFQISWFDLETNDTNFFYADTVAVSTAPVPLPSSALLVIGGVAALAGVGRKTRKRS